MLPNFNTSMSKAWADILCDLPAGGGTNTAISFTEKALVMCKHKILESDSETEPLLPVSFAQAKTWSYKQFKKQAAVEK